MSRDHLAPFFPNNTLPKELRGSPTGATAAALAIALFLSSYQLFRSALFCFANDRKPEDNLVLSLHWVRRVQYTLNMLDFLATYSSPVRLRLMDDVDFLDLLMSLAQGCTVYLREDIEAEE